MAFPSVSIPFSEEHPHREKVQGLRLDGMWEVGGGGTRKGDII